MVTTLFVSDFVATDELIPSGYGYCICITILWRSFPDQNYHAYCINQFAAHAREK
jgi:hypothetical protein